MAAVPCHKLSNMVKKAMNYNIIGIDEGQFVSFNEFVSFKPILPSFNMSLSP